MASSVHDDGTATVGASQGVDYQLSSVSSKGWKAVKSRARRGTSEFIAAARKNLATDQQTDRQTEITGVGASMQFEVTVDASHEADKQKHHEAKIGELASTAICGNDITASCFYVVGQLALNAGIWAPICTTLSSFTLYCFRGVYGEVVTALPLNGGIYNLLLNSSTKRTASVTACLTILSYVATGVVSAVSAAQYLGCAPDTFGEVPAVPTAIAILGFFACLMLMGMSESAIVATGVFLFHIASLLLVALFGFLFLLDIGLDQFHANWNWPHQQPMGQSIFYGFASAMLGVSGFETSANFVEEQLPGVFPKTLTNMWLCVTFINFTLSALSILLVPLDDLVGVKSEYAVAYLAETVGGPWLRNLIAIDALLVLAGSVLTSYVGVVGLFQRMAVDRCLPDFFAETNQCRGTPHYTILIFFAVCASMCILLNGDVSRLGAIYSMAFLFVMGLFAFCGLWLKLQRPTLPRKINTHPAWFSLGLGLVSIAFTAVVLKEPEMLTYFYIYYAITALVVMTTFARIHIFVGCLAILGQYDFKTWRISRIIPLDQLEDFIFAELARRKSQGVVYFTKTADICQLNRAILYIADNEEARWVRVIHVFENEEEIPENLLEFVQLLDCIYPKIRIDCIMVKGEFGPAVIPQIAKEVGVATNCMFITCPTQNFRHRLDTLGGVRVILNAEPSEVKLNERIDAHDAANGTHGERQALIESPKNPGGATKPTFNRSWTDLVG